MFYSTELLVTTNWDCLFTNLLFTIFVSNVSIAKMYLIPCDRHQWLIVASSVTNKENNIDIDCQTSII